MVFLILLVLASASSAQTAEDAAREMAEKIRPRLDRLQALRVTVRNLSSLGAGEFAEARRALDQALRRAGAEPGIEIRVTLADSAPGVLWVAEAAGQVAMVRGPARGATPATQILDKTLLGEQDDPMLDWVALAEGEWLVLEPSRVALHQAGRVEAAPLASTEPWPRDLRGRLLVAGDGFRAYLPGVVCHGSLRPRLSLDCRPGDESWALAPGLEARLQSRRNAFDGNLPFFAAAALPDGWIRLGLDGQVRRQDHILSGVPAGDLAGIHTSCGARLLATRPGDATEPDALQAYEVADRQATPLGSPVEFPGPVTALWPEPTGASAVAITRDLRTFRYAAYRISMACPR